MDTNDIVNKMLGIKPKVDKRNKNSEDTYDKNSENIEDEEEYNEGTDKINKILFGSSPKKSR